MQTLKTVLLAVLAVVVGLAVSVADAAVRVVSNTGPVEIMIPADLNDPNIVRIVTESGTQDCDGTPVEDQYAQYFLIVPVPGLNYWNAGSVTLTGMRYGEYLTQNLTYGYLSLDTFEKLGYISVAGQGCQQKYEYVFDEITGSWICQVDPEITCATPQRYLQDRVVLTPPPSRR